MKSGLIVIESVLELLTLSAQAHPPVRILVAADEETGSRYARPLLEEVATGCGAAIGFESPHPDGGFKVGRLGSVRVRLSVKGKEAHAALDPEGGVSATEEMVDLLAAIRKIAADASTSHSPVLYNLGSIEAPGRTNVVNEAATALLGFRFHTGEQEALVLDQIEALSPTRERARITVSIESRRSPWPRRAMDYDLARLLSDGNKGIPRGAAGAADTNQLGSGPFPVVDGFGPTGAGAHAIHEHINEPSLWERSSLLLSGLSNLERSPHVA